VLRPNICAANLLGPAPQIAAGQLFSTTEDGRTAWVHPRDIAELAAAAARRQDRQAGAVSSDLPTVLGRPATSIDTWIEEHAAALKG
jgi:uncharacterized protein YbjT (DUF2867 family)